MVLFWVSSLMLLFLLGEKSWRIRVRVPFYNKLGGRREGVIGTTRGKFLQRDWVWNIKDPNSEPLIPRAKYQSPKSMTHSITLSISHSSPYPLLSIHLSNGDISLIKRISHNKNTPLVVTRIPHFPFSPNGTQKSWRWEEKFIFIGIKIPSQYLGEKQK